MAPAFLPHTIFGCLFYGHPCGSNVYEQEQGFWGKGSPRKALDFIQASDVSFVAL